MLVTNFNNDLVKHIESEDIENANKLLMTELGNILVREKSDFIDMLNESDIEADDSMSDAQLIELFIDNTDSKSVLVGASLLAQHHNKQMSFDGENEINDEGVKSGVAVMDSYFNDVIPDEEYSYIAPFLLGGLVRGAKKLFGRNKDRNQSSRRSGPSSRQIAEQEMRRQVAMQKQIALEQQKRALEAQKAKQKMNTILIGGGALVLLVVVGAIIYVKKKK